ncbi:leucine-rich repeat (LRR) protein [Leptolyngbya sp. NIES-2104]|nr:leucine-rich repeat (LRR) protein [Leptolyngbya sp. NIES-2104]
MIYVLNPNRIVAAPLTSESLESVEISIDQTPSKEIIAQTINPTPSEIIVPLPTNPDEPSINSPTLEPAKPESSKPISTDSNTAKKILDAVILGSISTNSARYPWIVNPASNLLESTSVFTPTKTENYADVDIQYQDDQLLIRNFDFANFQKSDQFFWALPQNRLVLETRGWQGGIDYQGQETNVELDQRIRLTQSLWGLQAVWALPQVFRDLYGQSTATQFTIEAIAGEVTNPAGIPAPPIILNNSSLSPAAIRLAPTPPRLGTGSSNNPNGGGSLFQFLEVENAPLILQAFPTSDLQALTGAEGLFVGAEVPKPALEGAGIGWKDPFGGGTSTAPKISSLPGIKIGQLGKFDNLDLLNLLVNPNLSESERDRAYLNSLFWISLGQRSPQILRTRVTVNEQSFWHRFSINLPHNRTLLQYDATLPQVTYSNVFANPGFSLSVSFKEGEVNDLHSLNSTLGLLLGGLFSFIRPKDLTQSLAEGRDRYEKRQGFSPLAAKVTAAQRRSINQRLNRGLYYANRTSGLDQTSGTFTFPSLITPDRAELFQIRTGNQRRLARFRQIERTWTDGTTYFSRLRLSNQDFGRLSFTGIPVPSATTELTPNRSSAVQVALQSPEGQTVFQEFAAADSTVVPLAIRSSDIAFDRIELTQVGRAKTRINQFEGYLYLPTVEALWSASFGKWNYTVNSGIWFNLNGNSAFDVSRNNTGDPEPTIGLYLNSLINHIDSRVIQGADGKPNALVTMVPSLRLAWSSAVTPSNPGFLTLSHTYTRQQSNLNYSITPGFYLGYDNQKLNPVGFFQGQIGFRNGLEFRSSLELNSQFFYGFETLQRLSSLWSIGLYVQNYRSSDSLISRVSDLSYGMILRNRSTRGYNWRSRFGISGGEFEVRLEGGYQF